MASQSGDGNQLEGMTSMVNVVPERAGIKDDQVE